MTDTSKEAVERLLDGVTPGPWAYNAHREVGPLHTGYDQAYGMICDAVCEVNFDADHLGNARFIAASRELVPALLAEREALTAEVARLTAALGTDAARDVLAERSRQVADEGWAPEHDDAHTDGEIAQAAACYALNAAGWKTEALRGCWPIKWMAAWFKPTDPRRDLVKAAALILAEIERLDRSAHAARREGGV